MKIFVSLFTFHLNLFARFQLTINIDPDNGLVPCRWRVIFWTNDGIVYWHIDGLVQERRNSIANAPELRLSCTNPSIYMHHSASMG